MQTTTLHRTGWLGVLANLGIFGQVVFFLAVALLPAFQPGYSSFNEAISFLLLGPYGFVLSGALLAAGLGSFALALGIYQTTRGARGSLLGSALIGLWGISFSLGGIVFTDAEGSPTKAAQLFHGVVVLIAFLAAILGMLVLSRVFARDARWSAFYPLSLALGFAALVGLIDLLAISFGLNSLTDVVGPIVRSAFEGLGLLQRMFVGTLILWMLLAAARLRSIAKGGGSPP